MDQENQKQQEPTKPEENKPHGLGTLIGMIALVIFIAILASKCPFSRM